ncbi:RNA-binding protein [Methanolinea mesophila]|uniref:YhbY family RNA-binding protein n=1 Tax=Methanolinea mesophila TaxID=547055 RepID=UPI001AE7E65E|nr:YhbY family RNA-binding protein [Methanolinea mesophila]MBP1929710.1 RNA-binding protein [Methanolinea mesophila]
MNGDDKARAIHDLKPTIWIGKQGCTMALIEEIQQQLEKRRLVKIKWLKNTEVDPARIVELSGGDLVDVRGRTMVIAARKKK